VTNEQNKQQGQQDQKQPNQTGSVNPADKTKTNPGHEGYDQKNPQDISKKDPSRGHGSLEPQDREIGEGEKRRAS
jgi:hypothetical protein